MSPIVGPITWSDPFISFGIVEFVVLENFGLSDISTKWTKRICFFGKRKKVNRFYDFENELKNKRVSFMSVPKPDQHFIYKHNLFDEMIKMNDLKHVFRAGPGPIWQAQQGPVQGQ